MMQGELFLDMFKEDSIHVRRPIVGKVTFGSSLRLLRLRRNLKLEALAANTGIDLATLSRMENNKMVGSLKSYIKIGKVFGMSLSRLFFELEDERRGVNDNSEEILECTGIS